MSQRRVVINRPYRHPVHLRVKGKVERMADGSVGITCKSDAGYVYWLALTIDIVEELHAHKDDPIP